MLAILSGFSSVAPAVGNLPANGQPGNVAQATAPSEDGTGPLYIKEYRVEGAREMPRVAIEAAVYPFLGPGRTQDDVERARVTLEKAYKDNGYQAASVQVPAQQVKNGVVLLQVTEGEVGRLRVHGARYFLPSAIKEKARSLAEGKVVNFNDVTRDIVALNQFPDRRVTPALRAGVTPGTVDIDLNVKDTLPLHGSVELNNRYSADTTPFRLNGSISYNNLWQLGHSAGASFQVSPEDTNEVKVYSGYYLARLPEVNWLSLIVQGTKQDSNVSTIGGIAVAGRGEVVGTRAIITLPSAANFFQSVTFGIDYKHFEQTVNLGLDLIEAPVTYFPMSATYSATRATKNYTTDFNGGITFGVRGAGSDTVQFDNSRFKADGGFIYFRADLSHTHELPLGFQGYGKIQGQIADRPLVSSEQFSGGGLGTVRGYLEAEVSGDNAIFGSAELRSPSLLGFWGDKVGEWRIYAFCDGGALTIRDSLPEQPSCFSLASYGVGSRIRLFDHLNASIDAALPRISQTTTMANDLLLTFRVWAEF